LPNNKIWETKNEKLLELLLEAQNMHLQEFAKSTWHLSIFGKTEKIVLQQFGIQLDKF
jgi:hypothetical protein